MLHPSDAFGQGSYMQVRVRVLRGMRSAGIDDQVFELVQNAYERELSAETLVLSRAEKRRLLADVLKSVLDEMNSRLKEG